MAREKQTDYPKVCGSCRMPILTPALGHVCQRVVCPEDGAVLSKSGHCPECLTRFELPSTDELIDVPEGCAPLVVTEAELEVLIEAMKDHRTGFVPADNLRAKIAAAMWDAA